MKRPTFSETVRLHRLLTPPVSKVDLTGRTVLVTGANTGIGFQTAKYFATMSPRKIIIACRNEEKGIAAVARIRQETGFERVELRMLDLAKFSSVLEFVERFEKEEEQLDIHVANAAVVPRERRVTEDGWEESLQVNNISTILLSVLLLPLMVKAIENCPGSRPRIIIVGSTAMFNIEQFSEEVVSSDHPLRALDGEEWAQASGRHFPRYDESKLLSFFTTRALAHALAKTPIIVNCPCPGICPDTEISREHSIITKIILTIIGWWFGRTSEEGAKQVVWAALAHQEDPDVLKGAFIAYGSM
ncbi:NAD(P)-binding protein [Coprinopsis marcescibilis]|uniref:NAD(P)-binding protein n=1 Tax=Coprinopsis marcescibilis TaxID=230819 RepID=A0A5C3L2V5_COPMA|nr:NAD(P)-binding protein [Coprinopsis marcescibilis]